jgi:hypothetical protein
VDFAHRPRRLAFEFWRQRRDWLIIFGAFERAHCKARVDFVS